MDTNNIVAYCWMLILWVSYLSVFSTALLGTYWHNVEKNRYGSALYGAPELSDGRVELDFLCSQFSGTRWCVDCERTILDKSGYKRKVHVLLSNLNEDTPTVEFEGGKEFLKQEALVTVRAMVKDLTGVFQRNCRKLPVLPTRLPSYLFPFRHRH